MMAVMMITTRLNSTASRADNVNGVDNDSRTGNDNGKNDHDVKNSAKKLIRQEQ